MRRRRAPGRIETNRNMIVRSQLTMTGAPMTIETETDPTSKPFTRLDATDDPPRDASRARIEIPMSEWGTLPDHTRQLIRRQIAKDSFGFAVTLTGDVMATDALESTDERLSRTATMLREIGITHAVRSADTVLIVEGSGGKEARANAVEPIVASGNVYVPPLVQEPPAAPPGPPSNAFVDQPESVVLNVVSRVWISPKQWSRLTEDQKLAVMRASNLCGVTLEGTPAGAQLSQPFPPNAINVSAFVAQLATLGVMSNVLDAPYASDAWLHTADATPDTDDPPREKTERGAARAARRASAAAAREEHEDGDADDGIDPSVPYCSAGPLSNALNTVLKAAPRRAKDEQSVAFLVIASEGDRVLFGARDGHRWHIGYCATSGKVKFRTFAITLKSAKELLDTLNFAVKQFPKGSRVRFQEHTNSQLIWAISCAKLEPVMLELAELDPGKVPEGWMPPPFTGHDDAKAAIAIYDAKHISEATTWRGGGAIVKRDEVDGAGRRYIGLTDVHGEEILRAVIVPRGLTEGLPRSNQLEFDGALSPPGSGSAPAADTGKGKRKRKSKVDMTPGVAAGPAVRRAGDGKWRLERSSNGIEWHTLESGTESAVRAKFALPLVREGGASLRIIRPDGTPDKVHDGKGAKATPRARKSVGKSAKRAGSRRLETNVTPVGGRKPARLPKPTKGARRRK